MIDSPVWLAPTSGRVPRSGSIRVVFRSTDPLTGVGLAAVLQAAAFVVLFQAQGGGADVLVLVADRLTESVVAELRRSAAEFRIPVVLIWGEASDVGVFGKDTCRIVAALHRSAVTREHLLG